MEPGEGEIGIHDPGENVTEIVFCGYAFHIKHGVPREHREELWELWATENITYEEIPEHLKVYEFTPEGYEELEREEKDFKRGGFVATGNKDEDKDEDMEEGRLPGKP